MKPDTKFIFTLSLRVELYTNMLVVTLAVYFVYLAGNYDYERLIRLVLYASVISLINMVLGISVRFRRLSNLFNSLNSKGADYTDIKKRLLTYPVTEGRMICVRWIWGASVCYLLMNFSFRLTILESLPFVLGVLFVIPTSYVINYFTAENRLSAYMMKPEIRGAYLSRESYTLFSEFKRTILIVVSIAMIPIIILGYMSYLFSRQLIQVSNFAYYISPVIALSVITIFVVAYEATAGIRSGLKETVKTLKEMEEGGPGADPVPMLTRGEIGCISQYVNFLAGSLRNSDEKFSKAFRSSPAGIVIINLSDGAVVDINDSFLGMLDYRRDEIIGRALGELGIFHPSNDSSRLIHSLKKHKQLHDYNIQFRSRSGAVRYTVVSAEIIELSGKPCMIAIAIDVTGRKLLEKEIMSIGERERLKIGQDLHDDLAPHLCGVEALSAVLKKKLPPQQLGPIGGDLDTIIGLVKDAIAKTRSLARGLCPVYFADHGLETSLRELAKNTEIIYGASCRLNYDIPYVLNDISMCTNLYLIAQESVRNSIKNGAARNIIINLTHDNGLINFVIEDDGVGIPDSPGSDGMGIHIMNHRANLIGASFEIKNKADAGARVSVTFKMNGGM